jgi:hypothetical protein
MIIDINYFIYNYTGFFIFFFFNFQIKTIKKLIFFFFKNFILLFLLIYRISYEIIGIKNIFQSF